MIRKAVNRAMLFKNGDYVRAADKRSNVGMKENQVRYNIKNPDEYQVYQYLLDKGIIPATVTDINRCDQIVEFEMSSGLRIVYLVEFKGKDIPHAFEQLTSTIRLLFETDYRELCRHFKRACNKDEIEKIKGNMIRLRVISSSPGDSKTHGVNRPEERNLRKICQRLHIFCNKDEIIRRSGTCEEVH